MRGTTAALTCAKQVAQRNVIRQSWSPEIDFKSLWINWNMWIRMVHWCGAEGTDECCIPGTLHSVLFFWAFQSNVFRNSRFSSCSQAAVSGWSFLLDGPLATNLRWLPKMSARVSAFRESNWQLRGQVFERKREISWRMQWLDKRLGGTGVSRYHGCFLVMIDDDDGGRQMFDFRIVYCSEFLAALFEARRSKSGDEAWDCTSNTGQMQVNCK